MPPRPHGRNCHFRTNSKPTKITSHLPLSFAPDSTLLLEGALPSRSAGFKADGGIGIFIIIWEDKMEHSEDFQPLSCSESVEERYGRPKQQQKYVSGENNGKWSEKQNTQYIVYIEFHKDKMRSKEKRRVNKLYKEMAKFIGTRNALQCRSHHQKLEDRYLYPNKIIANYKTHNDLTLYHQTKLELEDFQKANAHSPVSHLKLQERILSNPTQPDLRGIDTPSAHSHQEGSNSEASSHPVAPADPPHPASFITIDAFPGVAAWGQYIYYPFFPIY